MSEQSSTTDQPSLRREATPHSRTELLETQQEAFDRVLGLLVAQAVSDWSPRSAPTPHIARARIDGERRNPVTLIDGHRGSGKTTTLLSVLEVLNAKIDPHQGQEELPEALKNCRAPIVPLSIVDLHPLPEDAGVLMAVVSKLRGLVDEFDSRLAEGFAHRSGSEIDQAAPTHTHATWLTPEQSSSRTAWNQFARDLTRWFGLASVRRAALDPEVAAIELAEEGADIGRSFRDFVDDLVAEYQRFSRGSEPPLFVIPIDDADMNPPRSVELLDLLRTLFHPRIAFVLTGDSDLFRRTLRSHLLASLWSRLSALPNEAQQVAAVSPAEYVARLANEIYDRVIPLSQRCVVEALRGPGRLSGVGDGLRGAFEAVEIPGRDYELGGRRVQNFGDLFGDKEDEHRLLAALPGRLRGHIDLTERLRLMVEHAERTKTQSPGEYRPGDLMARVAHLIWIRALEASSESYEVEELLRALVSLDEPRRLGRARLILRATRLRVRPAMHDVGEFERRAATAIRGHRIVARELLELRVDAKIEARWRPLARTAADALLMLLDLVSLDPLSVREGSGSVLEPAEFVVSLRSLVGGEQLRLGWPLPEWRSPMELDLFASEWRKQIVKAAEGRSAQLQAIDTVDALLDLFVRTTLGVLRDERGETGGTHGSWRELMIPHTGDSDLVFLWRSRLALLAAPEYGLPSALAGDLLNRMDAVVSDSAGWAALFELRQARVARAVRDAQVDTDAEALLNEWRKLESDHPWSILERRVRGDLAAARSRLGDVSETERLRFVDYFERLAEGSFAERLWSRGSLTSTYLKTGLMGEWFRSTSVQASLLLGELEHIEPLEAKVLAREVGASLPIQHRAAEVLRLEIGVFGQETARENLLRGLAADRAALTSGERFEHVEWLDWWSGVEVQGDREGERFRWPALAVPWMFEQDLMVARWNEACAQVEDYRTLVVRYLRMIEEFVTGVPGTGDLEATLEVLLRRRSGEEGYEREGSRRWRAFATFRSALVLFATPELMLPEADALAVLRAVSQHHEGDPAALVESAHALRRQLHGGALRGAGMGLGARRSTYSRHDPPEHPWTDLEEILRDTRRG